MRRAWLAAPVALATLAPPCAAQDVRFDETVDVERVVFDARVVDGRGRPLRGLSPADFRVQVDGREVALESAQWISAPGYPPPGAEAADASVVPGRLLVLFFQKDLDPSRVPGLLRMAARVREMVRRRAGADPVAVLSFDSRLRLWSDFTSSPDQVNGAVRAMLLGGVAAPAADPTLSLAAHLEEEAAARAATAPEALLVLARALRPLPGAKSLVLVGHGFGQMAEGTWSGRVDEDDGPYVSVRRALEDARAAVFALDVTNADAHTLEAGLMQVAEDTGGFYARTHVFAGEAMARLERALEGHYVLTFPRPVLPVGEHAVAIALVGRKGTVLAKRSYRG